MKRLLSLLFFFSCFSLYAQDIERNVNERLQEYFDNYTTANANIGKCQLDSFNIDYNRRKLRIYASPAFSYQPFREEIVISIYRYLGQILPGPVCFFDMTIITDGKPIEELIPNYYLDKRKRDKTRQYIQIRDDETPWVTNTSRPYKIKYGLAGHHIALWQSHGRYYQVDKGTWSWQRPHLFCTTEDQLTQSFIIPYIIPMLENAGAVVFTPRERDIQTNEVVVDNDTPGNSFYLEVKSRKARWQTTGAPGFAQNKQFYKDGENPFLDGTARFAPTERKQNRAFAEWVPSIPETGRYAVYVSYQTQHNSVTDAKYLVFHKGGVTEFKVNQQIGGGTWVYLGTFEFDRGNNDYGMVVLSNESKEKGVVCADAVRFGGGMGNIDRGSVSGFPRHLEAARYSAQWAGMPYEVYSPRTGTHDYNDDIAVRGNMINYLMGGSSFNPQQPGLKVPIEMSLALHTDAGFSKDDKHIGMLGVFTTDFNGGVLNSGSSRYASRELADLMLSQLRTDIQSTFNTQWTRRGMWNRNYGETRIPAVSSIILELLSHQNFADMRMAHDPNFKFTASRSIYKAMLRYLCTQYNKEYVVQPLPVSNFAVEFSEKRNTLNLSWEPEEDRLEPTAKPREYVVYTRIGYGGFDNGIVVNKPSYEMLIEPGLVYSFKVTAVNQGGESFPSEILSAFQSPREEGKVLIINGFTRISGPAVIDTPNAAGFDLEQDPGVPYQYNISLSGPQLNFDRTMAGKEGANALGYSSNSWEGLTIAGNTFDYPFIHGKAIQAAGGYSFVSCSKASVENKRVELSKYNVVDLILGLEKEDTQSNPARNEYYKTFSPAMQNILTAYCNSGGNLLVSGSYIGSDMISNPADKEFTENILKYSYQGNLSRNYSETITGLGRTLSIPRLPNNRFYSVTAPDCIAPTGSAFPVFIYSPDAYSAGIAYKGSYRIFALGFPFECIRTASERAIIMASVLNFFK
ncbi:xanthan lyase [Bacteroides sp. 214]|uniref:golvesin C-terminal-like domain-containing protein n=1 Tax=Bacteroides sp. 214 TaxID=2302935 RepID=UPI0013D26B44|nr:xanthan lyase [Bacteroides sp. 214]NDW11293.1 xanthan lyase [Bacteroides sp. 214]